MKNENELFPVIFNNKKYYKSDCGEMFLTFYTHPAQICCNEGIYIAEDVYVFPDDSMIDESED